VKLDGSRWALSNGTQTIPVLLGPTGHGTNLYGVEVSTPPTALVSNCGGPAVRGQSGRAELQQIYGFPKGDKQEPSRWRLPIRRRYIHRAANIHDQDGRPVPDFNQAKRSARPA
jgi:hypothetical protein